MVKIWVMGNMNIEKMGVLYKFVKLTIILVVVVISISSLCKRKPEENYLESVNVSNNSGRSENPSIAVDSNNTVHLVWNDDTPGNEEIFYAYKPANGNWSAPINISNNSRASRSPCITVDNSNIIHLAWQDCSPDGYWRIFYCQKSINGTWTIPETITGEYMYVAPIIAVDDSENVHLVWNFGGYYPGLRYSKRTKSGIWSSQTTIIGPNGNWNPSITADCKNNVHLAWYKDDSIYGLGNIFYSMKSENNSWTQPINISNTGKVNFYNVIIADDQGNIHFAWYDMTQPYLTPRILYREKKSDGTWTNPVAPCTLYKVFLENALAVGPQSELYIAGGDSARVLYLIKPQGQAFSDTIIIGIVNNLGIPWELICDSNGTLHFVWERGDILWVSYNPTCGR
jgi:hypothetical protein